VIHRSPQCNCDVRIEVLIRFSDPPGEGEEPIFGKLRGKDIEEVLWVRETKANGEMGDEGSKRIFGNEKKSLKPATPGILAGVCWLFCFVGSRNKPLIN